MERANREKWIDGAIGSIDQINRAEANPFLFSKVMQRWENRKAKSPAVIRPRMAWVVTACLVLLVGLNVITWVNLNGTKATAGNKGANTFGNEYFSFMNNYLEF